MSGSSKTTKSVTAPVRSDKLSVTPSAAESAYHLLSARYAAIPRERLAFVNIDLQLVAVFAVGVGRFVTDPAVRARFGKLAKTGEYDDSCTDGLVTAGHGAWYARHRYSLVTATRSEAKVPVSVLEEATSLRARQLRLCEYWLSEDPALAAEIAAIRAGTGHQDLANDLVALGALVERNHEELSQDRKLYRKGDAVRGKELADEILELLGAAASAEENQWAAALPRTWTHLLDVYNEVRRGGLFLFANDKGEERFPSLVRVGRTSSSTGRTTKEEPTGDADTSAPEDTKETSGSGGATG